MPVTVAIEGGKYIARVTDHGEVKIDRGDIIGWVRDPAGAKAWIAVLHELAAARRLLDDIASDFDPDKIAGPPCGPKMLAAIKKHFADYQVRQEHLIEENDHEKA